MEDRIFSPSFGNRPVRLVGRQGVLDSLSGGLATRPGSRERATLLLGQRGSGKTVLLLEMGDRAREAGLAVAMPTIVSEDMPERIIEKLEGERGRILGRRMPQLAEAGVSGLGVSATVKVAQRPQATSFQGRLAPLVRELNEHGVEVLILVDEVQANSDPVRQLVIAYQELVGEGANIALGMAGLPAAISATLNDHVLTFLNRATKLRLPPIPTADIDAFYAQSFEELGVLIGPGLRYQAATSAQGSAYLLQLVGHYLTLRACEGRHLSENEVRESLELARDDFETDVCLTTLAALSEVDVRFLAAMAQDEDGKPSRMSDVATHMGVTPDYAQKYRRRLLDAGVIEVAGRGLVRYAVPYLGDYLRREA